MDELIERSSKPPVGARICGWPTSVFVWTDPRCSWNMKPELVQAFPPASNQHGKSHWPVMRLVVLHDLETGLAERPYWGPLNGPPSRQ